jgi:hypothetical protein
MTSSLDISVATTLAKTTRDFQTNRQGPASGHEFEWSLYNAMLDIHSWRHASGPDQFDMGLPISSRTGIRYEFDAVFASTDTLYVIEAKRLSGGGLTREHVGVFVQKLLDTLLGSYEEIGHLAVKPVIVSALSNVDDAARCYALAWGILIIAPTDATLFEMLHAIQSQHLTSTAAQDLAHECGLLASRLWRPFNSIFHPAQQSHSTFSVECGDVYDANHVRQLLVQVRECAEAACSLGLEMTATSPTRPANRR